jgi:two-component system, OmpR family, sensor histidine kinase ChvG
VRREGTARVSLRVESPRPSAEPHPAWPHLGPLVSHGGPGAAHASPARPKDDFVVEGHESRLGQVIANLIDNARSFSPPEGEVRLTLRRREAGSNRPRAEVEITVEDDGPGIPPHALERVFERFYTDRPVEGFGQNSGLGLSISRQIAEAHRGRIVAENRPGKGLGPDGEPARLGARFTVTLPAARP